MNQHNGKSKRSRRVGLTLVEVIFSTMLVGVVLVGAMDLLGAVVRGRTGTTESARAEQLAHQLMAEILRLEYQDDTAPVFGREIDEVTGLRSGYDDVDDFHTWSPLSILGLDNAGLVNTTGWQWETTVEYVNPANPAGTSATDQGVKRVTVTVKLDGQVMTRLVALRTDKYTVP